VTARERALWAGVAETHERLAKQIRQALDDGEEEPNHVTISEAIRAVLRERSRHASEITRAVRLLPLRTRSENLASLVSVTLARLHRMGDLRKDGEGRWWLT